MAGLSAVLLVLAFPDFNLSPLAWIGLTPVIVVVLRAPHLKARAFLLGWITGTIFFYGSCYWLTYAMVRYGHIPTLISYLLVVPMAITAGLFPASFMLILARAVARFGIGAVFAAPFVWVALEWGRLGISGQLWNAIGYSQAYAPGLIQSSRWGGVYAVGFLILLVNASVVYSIARWSIRGLLCSSTVVAAVIIFIALQAYSGDKVPQVPVEAVVVAVQPNVPMEPVESIEESEALFTRHLQMSREALREVTDNKAPHVVIWPESPMNFMYARDPQFRELLAAFTKANQTSVIFNGLEPDNTGGSYNAAVMVNEEGRLISQYDKIRLLPFGEYVPLPHWLPGNGLISGLAGNFTPGTEYPLLPLGKARAGIFICFESAFPSIARRFANDGADLLINISNDGYLGPTPVMRQHLANAVFRAVENDRPVLRVTNTGITAYITSRGQVQDATNGFETAVRRWTVTRVSGEKTFYTRHGDVFVGACAALAILLIIASSLNVQNLIKLKP